MHLHAREPRYRSEQHLLELRLAEGVLDRVPERRVTRTPRVCQRSPVPAVVLSASALEAIDRLYAAIPLINELGVAILLIEQNVYRSLQVADRAYVLDRGSVSFAGDPSELREEERLSLAYFGTPRGGERASARAPVTTSGGES
jgi:ABC-type cobalamin transport system ATPase subunit